MKITLLSFMLLSVLLTACSKTNPDSNPAPPPSQPLSVVLSKSNIEADGFEETVITVKDQNNVDVTQASVIYVNNIVITGNKFSTSMAGTYPIKAVKGNLESSAVSLTVTDPGPSPFTQKVLGEFYTGTWCGICPGVLIPLDNYAATHPNFIPVGLHGPVGSSDPFTYIYDPQLRSAFSVSGVPTVVLNRDSKWNADTAVLNQLQLKRPPLGIAFETNINGMVINVKTKVKFDVTTSLPLKLVVTLVEDSLVYNQANYGHFGLPNPIPAFKHRNVLRSAATDIFGDAIPASQQIKGNTWVRELSFNASGYNIANCRIIAFVVFDNNNQNRKGVLNAQIAVAGQNKDFD